MPLLLVVNRAKKPGGHMSHLCHSLTQVIELGP